MKFIMFYWFKNNFDKNFIRKIKLVEKVCSQGLFFDFLVITFIIREKKTKDYFFIDISFVF